MKASDGVKKNLQTSLNFTPDPPARKRQLTKAEEAFGFIENK
jgi:hypothetical protein